MTTPREADVALIGLGAAGGVAAHVLTDAGLEVVALEAGPRLSAGMMSLDEVRNDVRAWMSAPKAIGEAPTWRFEASQQAGPSPFPVLMMNAVGGTSIHYDAWSLRFLPWHFQSRTRVIERYGAEAIPPDSTLADWPVTYDDLEPYYDAVEYAIGIAGQAGNIRGELQAGGNPFEAPRSRGLPMPGHRASGWNARMAEAGERLGWHPFQVPAAINSRPYNGNSACTYCGYCANNGCYVNAKGSTNVTLIPRAEASGRLRIETSARVVRIEVDGDGAVRGVTYVQDGREQFQPARVVLLGGFVYENTRLLLLSRSSAYPQGLSNNHGQVGRHYMAHVIPSVSGVFPGLRLNRFTGSGGQIMCVDDWNGDNFDHSQVGFIGGGMLSSLQELRPIGAAAEHPPRVGRWGSEWKAWVRQHAQSVGGASAQMENLPYEGNVLDLDPVETDPYGVPVVRVTHSVRENERRGWAYLRGKLEEWLREAGAAETWSRDTIRLDGRHAYGGTRMGHDPATSVVDEFGFSHEAPNLGVIGASNFPTTAGYNPTHTLQALTWRTAQHLVDEWEIRSRGRR